MWYGLDSASIHLIFPFSLSAMKYLSNKFSRSSTKKKKYLIGLLLYINDALHANETLTILALFLQ